MLLLGSMPGGASLAARAYYAHPQNAFWRIMESLFGIPAGADYGERTTRLAAAGIALWDVLRSCRRRGSLDSAIERDSLVANRFDRFFETHRGVRAVFFNGGCAAALYRRAVLPGLRGYAAGLPLHILPSSSPARANIRLEEKIEAWRALLPAARGRIG